MRDWKPSTVAKKLLQTISRTSRAVSAQTKDSAMMLSGLHRFARRNFVNVRRSVLGGLCRLVRPGCAFVTQGEGMTFAGQDATHKP